MAHFRCFKCFCKDLTITNFQSSLVIQQNLAWDFSLYYLIFCLLSNTTAYIGNVFRHISIAKLIRYITYKRVNDGYVPQMDDYQDYD